MSNFGFFGGVNGYIEKGFKALTLRDHGRMRIGNEPQFFSPSEGVNYYEFIMNPPIQRGEIIIPFVLLENNNPRSLYDPPKGAIKFYDNPPTAEYNSKVLVPNLPNSDAPYIYLFSTSIPKIDDSDYGMEIYDEQGNPVFNTNIKPMRIISSELVNDKLSNIPIMNGKEIAVNDTSSNYDMIWRGGSRYSQYTQYRLRREGVSLQALTSKWDQNMYGANPPFVTLQYHKTKNNVCMIDVSHIKRKG